MNGRTFVPERFMTTNQLEKIETALKMDYLFDDWTAEFKPDEALVFLEKAQVYNRIVRKDILSLISFINQQCPNVHYKIGNEGSRVIYAIIFGRNKIFGGLFEEIEHMAKTIAHCDEFSVITNVFQYQLRMWWD